MLSESVQMTLSMFTLNTLCVQRKMQTNRHRDKRSWRLSSAVKVQRKTCDGTQNMLGNTKKIKCSLESAPSMHKTTRTFTHIKNIQYPSISVISQLQVGESSVVSSCDSQAGLNSHTSVVVWAGDANRLQHL